MFAREERCRGLSQWLFSKLKVDRNDKPTKLQYDWLIPEFGRTKEELEQHEDGKIFDPTEGHKLFSAYANPKRYFKVSPFHLRDPNTRGESPAILHERKLLSFLHDMDSEVDGFAALAVADFIIDPLHMINTYLTLAGRLKTISEDSAQKFDVQERALKFSEICCVAAASCLETLDTISSSKGANIERSEQVAGGSLSAMVLRAANVDTKRPPTLAPIKIAIDKSLGAFLSQPIVYLFLKREWSGYDRYSGWHGRRWGERPQIGALIFRLVVGFLLVAPFLLVNLILLLFTTIFPAYLGELRECLRGGREGARGWLSRLDLTHYLGVFMCAATEAARQTSGIALSSLPVYPLLWASNRTCTGSPTSSSGCLNYRRRSSRSRSPSTDSTRTATACRSPWRTLAAMSWE